MKFTLIAQPLMALAVLAMPSNVNKRDLAAIQGAITNVQKSLGDLGTAVNVSHNKNIPPHMGFHLSSAHWRIWYN